MGTEIKAETKKEILIEEIIVVDAEIIKEDGYSTSEIKPQEN